MIRLRGLGPLLAALVLSSLAPALARADASFEGASAAYAAGRFDEASRELEAVMLERGYAPGALYNLGQAYARAGEPALAILALERARLLEPSDPRIAESLDAIRRSAGLSAPTASALEELAALLPARHWLAAFAAALALFVLAALAAGALRRARGALSLAAVLALAVAAACGAALWIGTLATDRAIVIAERAALKVSPFAEADSLLALPPGELVRIEEAHGDHLRVVAPGGREGWMAREHLARIVPSAR